MCTAFGPETFRSGWNVNEFTLFGEDEQVVGCTGDGRRSDRVRFPTHASFSKVHTPQLRAGAEARIGATMDSVEEAVVFDTGGIVIGKKIVP